MSLDPRKMNRLCVVCGREFGPSLQQHCTDRSLVLVRKEGLFKKRFSYFRLDGKQLDELAIATIKKTESLRMQSVKDHAVPTHSAGQNTSEDAPLTGSPAVELEQTGGVPITPKSILPEPSSGVAEPVDANRPMFAPATSADVRFLRKHTKGNSTYEVYQANTADAARQFLLKKHVSAPLYFIVVETPEGTWGTDVKGLYLEHLLSWQSDLSVAEVVGRAAEGLGSVESAQFAAMGYADNWIHGVICGRCESEWLDGLQLNRDTVVRCPNCAAMNRVTPPVREFFMRSGA